MQKKQVSKISVGKINTKEGVVKDRQKTLCWTQKATSQEITKAKWCTKEDETWNVIGLNENWYKS